MDKTYQIVRLDVDSEKRQFVRLENISEADFLGFLAHKNLWFHYKSPVKRMFVIYSDGDIRKIYHALLHKFDTSLCNRDHRISKLTEPYPLQFQFFFESESLHVYHIKHQCGLIQNAPLILFDKLREKVTRRKICSRMYSYENVSNTFHVLFKPNSLCIESGLQSLDDILCSDIKRILKACKSLHLDTNLQTRSGRTYF